MPDQPYKTLNFILQSKGVGARPVDDTLPESQYLDLDNCEELAENAFGTRLGLNIINQQAGSVYPLPGPVHSLQKLSGLNGNAWRYAGSGTNLYRGPSASEGPYTLIASDFSGQPWGSASSTGTEVTSAPYMFFADANQMRKDNGTLINGFVPGTQQMGIFQPQYPAAAESQEPDLIILDNYVTAAGSYTYTGISGGTLGTYVNTTLTSAVTATGLQEVSVAAPTQPGLFQLLTVGSGGGAEVVLVLLVTATGFWGVFTKTHANGSTVANADLSVTVPASTTASVSISFATLPVGAKPIAAWPTVLQQADYIGLFLFVSNPTSIQSIQLSFDCGDGTFNSDYFYKIIAQGPLQALLNTAASGSTSATTAATDALLDDSLGLYGNSAGSIAQLQTGLNNWTPLLIQLSDFASAGQADFSDPVYNWANVNGYQITIVTNDGGSVTVNLSSLVLFGGNGPDSFAGVGYDYLFTFYNNVDGTESNPCMSMTNISSPNNTNWVFPRRQPVQVTMTYATAHDPQITSLRVYRRGGTLGDNYRRVDEVLLTGSPQKYIDASSDVDIQQSDFVSFTNDVPVTSSLPFPVSNTLQSAIATTNQVATVLLASAYEVSTPFSPSGPSPIQVNQQVNIGNIGSPANNFETVIVLVVLYGSSGGHRLILGFQAFVQNTHAAGEMIAATASYGQPVTIMAQAFGQMWFAGDPNNPSYLYWSNPDNPQGVSSAAYVSVGSPDDPITVIVQFKGNLYVSTRKFWWQVAPGSNQNASPTVYPTAAKHGCVAPLGWTATEDAIYYQAIDGLRAFAGGGSQYLTQDQEFIFQGVGTSPIVEADPTQFSQTRAAYWNNMVFFSYIGVDGDRHRVIYHTIYRRWRNDDVDSQSLFLEADTNLLVTGDSNGLIYLDRQNQAYDEGGNNEGLVVQDPIAMNLITPYRDQGLPEEQKQYQNFVLDADTGGVDVTVTLLFNDGEFSQVLGVVNTTERQRVNLNMNAGLGFTAYKIALQLTATTIERVYYYQASIQYLSLARTRQSFDTYELKCGGDDSKLCRYCYAEYTASEPITFSVYYDASPTPGYTFTLPASSLRQSQRVTLPAVLFRLIRLVAVSDADFQLWSDSCLFVKFVCAGRGYEKIMLGNMEG